MEALFYFTTLNCFTLCISGKILCWWWFWKVCWSFGRISQIFWGTPKHSLEESQTVYIRWKNLFHHQVFYFGKNARCRNLTLHINQYKSTKWIIQRGNNSTASYPDFEKYEGIEVFLVPFTKLSLDIQSMVDFWSNFCCLKAKHGQHILSSTAEKWLSIIF